MASKALRERLHTRTQEELAALKIVLMDMFLKINTMLEQIATIPGTPNFTLEEFDELVARYREHAHEYSMAVMRVFTINEVEGYKDPPTS